MSRRQSLRYVLSAFIAVAAGIATSFILAIILGIIDIYLAGHSRPTLGRTWLEYPEWGIYLSRADTILLTGAFMVTIMTAVLLIRFWKRDD